MSSPRSSSTSSMANGTRIRITFPRSARGRPARGRSTSAPAAPPHCERLYSPQPDVNSAGRRRERTAFARRSDLGHARARSGAMPARRYHPAAASQQRGALAEWLGRGLQSLVQRFESARRLYSYGTEPGAPGEIFHALHRALLVLPPKVDLGRLDLRVAHQPLQGLRACTGVQTRSSLR